MNTVEKYAVIPFSKYQRLLRTTNTTEPPSLITNHSETNTLNKHTALQIGAGNGRREVKDKEEKATLNDINTSISKRLNATKS